jgi:hypothetical protein
VIDISYIGQGLIYWVPKLEEEIFKEDKKQDITFVK